MTGRNDSHTKNHHYVVYDNHLFDNGDWTFMSGAMDHVGILMGGSLEDAWILGNHVHNIEGDALALPSEFLFPGSLQSPATRVYIGRNHFHHCRENHIDGKLTQSCVISQNKLHTDWICDERRMGVTRGGNALYMHCLPADIGAEVSAEVMRAARFDVTREAHKKLYVIMALLAAAKTRGLRDRLAALVS